MTSEFCDLIYLFKCAVYGETEISDIKTDMKVILREADRHGICTVIFPAVKILYNSGRTSLTKADFEALNLRFMAGISVELKRRYAIDNAVKKLEQQGVECCMLKGEVFSALYAVPETRVSGDCDIYIGAENEEKVCGIMAELGFEVLDRPSTSHHAMCYSSATGLIEFHLTLHDELFQDVWFNDLQKIREPFRKCVTKDNRTYTTLGVTDGAVFVILHFIKHFLSQGAGIRQLMDMLLYIKHYMGEIDTDVIINLMRELKYNKFLRLCMDIGIKYLGFQAKDFGRLYSELSDTDIDTGIIDEVLTDIEQGGIFGHDEQKRKNFYKLYTEARFGRFKEGSFVEYMNEWNHVSLLRRMFPRIKHMKKRYTALSRYPILLPYYYAKRIVIALCGVRKRKIKLNPYKNIDGDKERLKLIEKLDMI